MSKSYLLLCFLLIFITVFVGQVYGESVYIISTLDNDVLKVESLEKSDGIRIMVEKDNEKYYYSLKDSLEIIPLQLGMGKYTVKILENTSGDKFKVLKKEEVNITKESDDSLYLKSTQPVYWKNKREAISLAQTLIKDKDKNVDKVQAIYDYIVNNIEYDYEKMDLLNSDYIPDIDNVLKNNSGICYDYAALTAGMLRSQGIPTKLVKGYKNDLKAYHAWNEVLLDNNWVIVDTTYDAALGKNRNNNMLKNSVEYNKIREY